MLPCHPSSLSAQCIRRIIQTPALVACADQIPPRNRPIILEEIIRHNLFVAYNQSAPEAIAVLDMAICELERAVQLRLHPGQEVSTGVELSELFCLRRCESLTMQCRPYWHRTFSDILFQLQNIRSLSLLNLNVSDHLFLNCLPATTNLTKLHLEIYSDEHLPPIDFSAVLAQNPNIQDFNFYQKMHTEDLSQFCVDLACAPCAPKLTRLHLRNFRTGADFLELIFEKCVALEVVKLDGLFQLCLDRLPASASWRSCRLGFAGQLPSPTTLGNIRNLPKTIETLSCDFWFSHELHEEIFELPNVTDLSLKYRIFPDEYFKQIFSRTQTALREINVGYVNDTQFTDASFHALAEPFLNFAAKNPPISYQHHNSQSYPGLHKLVIQVDQPNQPSSGYPLIPYFQNKLFARQLTVLNLYGFVELSQELLDVMAKNCINLEEMQISSKFLTDDVLISFGRNAPRLVSWNLSNCVSLTDRGVLFTFTRVACCVKHLDLAHCTALSDGVKTFLHQPRPTPLAVLLHEKSLKDDSMNFYRRNPPPLLID